MSTNLGYAIAASVGKKDLDGFRDPELDQYLGMEYKLHEHYHARAAYINSKIGRAHV